MAKCIHDDDDGQHEVDDSRPGVAQVELVDSKRSEQDCQDSGRYLALQWTPPFPLHDVFERALPRA